MSVNIPISADTSSAQRSVSDLMAGFRRLEDVLARTGNAGKKLSDMNWDSDELRQYATHVERVSRALDEVRKVKSSKTAQTLGALEQRAGARLDPVEVYRHAQTALPNQQVRDRFLGNLGLSRSLCDLFRPVAGAERINRCRELPGGNLRP